MGPPEDGALDMFAFIRRPLSVASSLAGWRLQRLHAS